MIDRRRKKICATKNRINKCTRNAYSISFSISSINSYLYFTWCCIFSVFPAPRTFEISFDVKVKIAVLIINFNTRYAVKCTNQWMFHFHLCVFLMHGISVTRHFILWVRFRILCSFVCVFFLHSWSSVVYTLPAIF